MNNDDLDEQLHAILHALDVEQPDDSENQSKQVLNIYFELDDEQETDEPSIVESTITEQTPTTNKSYITKPLYPPNDKTQVHQTTREKKAHPIFLTLLTLALIGLIGGIITSTVIIPYFVLTATVTLVLKEKDLSLQTTVHVKERSLPTLTLSQSKTVQATGKGHSDATFASGYLTFYNGLLTSQTVLHGTVFTASNGVPFVNDQNAIIPAAVPPSEGQVTIAAHALQAGSVGNMYARGINMPCCGTGILVTNLTAFTGGQDAKDYTYVIKKDIESAGSSLKSTVSQFLHNALSSQLTSDETLSTTNCSTNIASNHQVGDEATNVIVTVSQSCNAFAYKKQDAYNQAVNTIILHAKQILGNHYTLVGDIQVNTVKSTQNTVTFAIHETWVYHFTDAKQSTLKKELLGKKKNEAEKILSGMEGISSFTVNGDMPMNLNHIQLIIFS